MKTKTLKTIATTLAKFAKNSSGPDVVLLTTDSFQARSPMATVTAKIKGSADTALLPAGVATNEKPVLLDAESLLSVARSIEKVDDLSLDGEAAANETAMPKVYVYRSGMRASVMTWFECEVGPEAVVPADTPEVTISGDDFRLALKAIKAIARGGFAGATFEEVLLEFIASDDEKDPGTLKIAVTDSVRLAVLNLKPTTKIAKSAEVRINANTLKSLIGDPTKHADGVTIRPSDDVTGLTFSSDGIDWSVVALNSSRTFPNYRQIIPHSHVGEIVGEAELLGKSFERGAKIGVKYRVEIKTDDLGFVSLTTKGDGDAIFSETLPTVKATKWGGNTDADSKYKPVRLAFNGTFVKDGAGLFAGKIKIAYTSSVHPATIQAADGSDKVLYLLMPINL